MVDVADEYHNDSFKGTYFKNARKLYFFCRNTEINQVCYTSLICLTLQQSSSKDTLSTSRYHNEKC